jgi:ankyrin repeat protein
MANTDSDAGTLENTEVSAENPPQRQKKKRVAAAIVVIAVLSILLGVAGWVFLFPHPDIPERASSGLTLFSEVDKELLQAVRDNDAEGVSRLLRAGAEANAMDSSGTTPMRAAIALNRVDIVRRFLEANGGSPLIREDNSLLLYAIVQNRAEIARELMKLTINIDKTDKNGFTPLMYAIDRNHTTIARDLLKAGADVNRLDRYGQTPLMLAATVAKPDMTSLLLEAGADTGILSPEGETAMSIAQKKNRNVVIALLLNAGSPIFY